MARIFIVEDEMLVAMLIEDVIVDLGHEVIGPAMRLDAALVVAKTEQFDFAILDINLAGKQSFPVADMLTERGIPFMFASGYGAAGLSSPYDGAPILQKPFSPEQIELALRNL